MRISKGFTFYLPVVTLMVLLNLIAVMASPFSDSAFATSIGTDIYSGTEDNILADKVEQVVRIVGGVGGIAFVLAVLIVALFIIFGSIASHRIGTFWKALISCVAGAFIFFSAYAFAPAIAKLAQG